MDIQSLREVEMPEIDNDLEGFSDRVMNSILWGHPDGYQGEPGNAKAGRDEYDSRVDDSAPWDK